MSRTATFYTHVANIEDFVCRLIRTVYDSHTPICICCRNEEQMTLLDQKLWINIADSFLAHDILQDKDTHASIVLLVAEQNFNQYPYPTVLNLADKPCIDDVQVTRVLEIVGSSDIALAAARNRFRIYRDSGFKLEHHKMQK